jgi:olefin beta-lactone synthetase
MHFYIDTPKRKISKASSSKPEIRNLADLFLRHIPAQADMPALTIGREIYSFEDLRDMIFQFQHALIREEFKSQERILILAPVQVELYALFYAMSSLQLVPVFIDTGLGIRGFLKVIRKSQVTAIISTSAFFKFRWLVPALFSYKRYSLNESGSGFKNLKDLFPDFAGAVPTMAQSADSTVLITYTTGSTGQAKGADRSHRVLFYQYLYSQRHWPEANCEIDMPWFPMVAFQNLNCGIQTVLPKTNFRKIDDFEPREIVSQISSGKVTRMSAPPSVYAKLCRYMIQEDIQLPSVQRLIVGGAPVSKKIALLIRTAFPHAQAHVVYGSTEAEPIAFASLEEVLESSDEAYLVGRPIPELSVKICNLSDRDIPAVLTAGLEQFETGGIGEIIIEGEHVIKRYFDNDKANQLTKIRDEHGRVWHRTGDLGFFDHLGRLWLVGRIKDGSVYGLEHQIEMLPGINRAAIIKKRKKWQLVLEATDRLVAKHKKEICRQILADSGIMVARIKFIAFMPVDRRHQWKIDRTRL